MTKEELKEVFKIDISNWCDVGCTVWANLIWQVGCGYTFFQSEGSLCELHRWLIDNNTLT